MREQLNPQEEEEEQKRIVGLIEKQNFDPVIKAELILLFFKRRKAILFDIPLDKDFDFRFLNNWLGTYLGLKELKKLRKILVAESERVASILAAALEEENKEACSAYFGYYPDQINELTEKNNAKILHEAIGTERSFLEILPPFLPKVLSKGTLEEDIKTAREDANFIEKKSPIVWAQLKDRYHKEFFDLLKN